MTDSYHFYTVVAYAHRDPMGQLQEAATVGVYAESEAEALEKAARLVARASYTVTGVLEHQPDREARGT